MGSDARERGFVLVVVLGVLFIFAIIAASLIRTSSLAAKARRALQANVELSALADGAARLIAFRIGEQRGGVPLPDPIAVDGRWYTCAFRSARLEFHVQDQGGLLDLNLASREHLTVLLGALRVADPSGLASAIVDFRDSDDNRLPGGAERDDYTRANLPHAPKNSRFEAVEELDQVLGMTPDLLVKLMPFVTVHGTQPSPDPAVAPPLLRDVLGLGSPGSQLPTGAERRQGARGRSRVLAVHVRAINGEAATTRRAIVSYEDASTFGFIIRNWQSNGLVMPTTPSQLTRINCT